MGIGHQPDRYAIILLLFIACTYIFCYIFDLVLLFYLFFWFLANEVDEVSDEEEARIKGVINYLIHAYPDLVTPA